MIGKVFLTGKTFAETCEYLEREEAQGRVLAAEGVRMHDHRLMAEDFEWQHRLMPEKEKPVFHAVLSFPPGERVDDERLVEISREYLRRIGMMNTQYAVVKHTDKEHLHAHIVANRVNNDGEPTGKGLIIQRSIKAAKELTAEYGLRQENGKRLDATHLEALHEPDAKRYRIYAAIREVLPQSRDLSDFEGRLQERGIAVRYRDDPVTQEHVGISFRLENRSFKGSGVDADFSFRKLSQALEMQQREVLALDSLEAVLAGFVQGNPVAWDERESAQRRQDLKLRLERAEQERAQPKRVQGQRRQQEKELEPELQQEVSRRLRHGLGL